MARATSLIWLASAGCLVIAAGCSGSVDGGSGGSTTSSTVVSSANAGGAGGAGGGGVTSGTGGGMGGAGGSGTVGSSGSGTATTGTGMGGAGGGMSNYTTCGECTADTGAIANECKALYDDCMTWKTCVSLYNCNYFGLPGGPGPCDSTVDGACCSLSCDKMAAAGDAEGVAKYRALDNCIYCKTCTGLCQTGEYCKVFEPGGSTVCQ